MELTKKVLGKTFFNVLILIFAASGIVVAQDLRKMEVVYSPPNMDKVKVQQDVGYKTVKRMELSMDLYYPPLLKEDEN